MTELMPTLMATLETHINTLVDARVAIALANAVEYPEGILNKTIDQAVEAFICSSGYQQNLVEIVETEVSEAMDGLDVGHMVEEAIGNLTFEVSVR
jgi:hypothetical protein